MPNKNGKSKKKTPKKTIVADNKQYIKLPYSGNDQESEKYKVNKDKEPLNINDPQIKDIKDELKKHLDKDRVTTITVFGIFASIVTFLSIEMQILKSICDFYRLLGFSLYLLGALLSFIFVLQFIGKSRIENDKTTSRKDFRRNPSIIITLIVVLVLLFSGFVNMSLSKESEAQCRNDKYQEEITIINGNIEDLTGELENMGKNWSNISQKIQQLEDRFNSLQKK